MKNKFSRGAYLKTYDLQQHVKSIIPYVTDLQEPDKVTITKKRDFKPAIIRYNFSCRKSGSNFQVKTKSLTLDINVYTTRLANFSGQVEMLQNIRPWFFLRPSSPHQIIWFMLIVVMWSSSVNMLTLKILYSYSVIFHVKNKALGFQLEL